MKRSDVTVLISLYHSLQTSGGSVNHSFHQIELVFRYLQPRPIKNYKILLILTASLYRCTLTQTTEKCFNCINNLPFEHRRSISVGSVEQYRWPSVQCCNFSWSVVALRTILGRRLIGFVETVCKGNTNSLL